MEQDGGVPFNLNLAVLLAGFAFESYNDPKVDADTPQNTDSRGCTTTFLSKSFLLEQFSGQLQLKLTKATDCPAMDLWGTSDPYAVVQVGPASARTKTIWATKEPVWNESLSLFVQTNKKVEEEFMRVSLWDAGVVRSPRRMGSAALPLTALCDGEKHEVSLAMEGPGGGATVFLEVQYKSFELLAEEERRRWRLPSVYELLPQQLVEAAAIPGQMLSTLFASASGASSSPSISASEFVESALRAFDAPFPDSVGAVKAAAQDPLVLPQADEGSAGPDKGTAAQGRLPEASGDASVGKDKEASSSGLWSVVDTALSALQTAGWLQASPGETSGVPMEGGLTPSQALPGQQRPQGCIDLQNVPQAGEGGGSGSGPPPDKGLLERKNAMRRQLVEAGLAAPGDEEGGEQVPSVVGDWKAAVFGQTEAMLEWLAVLGAAKEATQAQGLAAPPQEQALQGFQEGGGEEERQKDGDPLRDSAPGSVSEEADIPEEQKQAMKEIFGRAETAVEAWTMLASSLGQQTIVKSEFEKIAFMESQESDTQLAVWRDAGGRRLVVAFRGTEQSKLKDLLTDIKLVPTGLDPERTSSGNFDQDCMVHYGFLTAYDSVRAQVLALLRDLTDPELGVAEGAPKPEPWRLYVTGHSLGGALATLLTKELSEARFVKDRGVQLTMYNYGSPRVGNNVFATEYNHKVKDSWRIVNHRDIIPTVPRLMGYRHVCCPVYLNPLPPNAPRRKGEGAGVGPTSQEEDGYLGDVIGEKTASDLVGELTEVSRVQRLFDRLLQTEIAMVNALRDGSAISMHMEDFYFVALLKKAREEMA